MITHNYSKQEVDELKARLESDADLIARLRRQVDEAVECCIIKDNRNLRLEARLAAAETALRDACIGHPDNCVCNGCRLAFRATDSASVCPVCYGMGVQKMDDGEPRPCVKCNGRRTVTVPEVQK